MKRWIVGVASLFMLLGSACQGSSPATATTRTGSVATPTVSAQGVPSSVPSSTDTVAFFLDLSGPKDQAVVATPSLQVAGRTTADAVVTVNGQVVDVDETGAFSTTVSLEKGPNVIEVNASDFQGNNQSEVRTVIYSA